MAILQSENGIERVLDGAIIEMAVVRLVAGIQFNRMFAFDIH